jgi:hypothetical protein
MTNAEKYKEQLRNVNRDTATFERWGFDKRIKAFTPCGCIFCKNCAMNELKEKQGEKDYVGCNHARMTWLLSEYEEPIMLTELEYNILKFIADNTNNIYIARDMKGSLFLYEQEPKKMITDNFWIGRGVTPLTPFDKLFRFVMWEDKEPYSIKEILKHCRVIGDNIAVHKVGDEKC